MRPDQNPIFVGAPRIGVIQFHANGAVEILDVIFEPNQRIRNCLLGKWRIDFGNGSLWIRTANHIHCFRFNWERQGWDYAAEERRGGLGFALIFTSLMTLWWYFWGWVFGS